MLKFAILLGGDVVPTTRLREQLKGARVIAADSGMRHASVLNVEPELWVGDFDSADANLLEQHASVERITFPVAKDASDGELALREALTRGATELVLVGAFGGRFDHALAHATMLVKFAEQGVNAFATSGREEAWPLVSRLSLTDLDTGTRLSIIGLTDLGGLTVSHVRWPLQRRDVDLGSTLTLSNEVEGDVSITLEAGRAVVLVYAVVA